MDPAARAPAPRAEHTPGPWWAEDSDDCWRLFGSGGPTMADLQILKAPKRATPYAEYWPNAADSALIVAAPDLLAACRHVLANSEHSAICPTVTRDAASCTCYYAACQNAVQQALGAQP